MKSYAFTILYVFLILGCNNDKTAKVPPIIKVPQLAFFDGGSIRIKATEPYKLIESQIIVTDDNKPIENGTQFKLVADTVQIGDDNVNWLSTLIVSSNEGKISFYVKPHTVAGLYRVNAYPVESNNIKFDQGLNARYFINVVPGPPHNLGEIKTDFFEDLPSYNNQKNTNESWIVASSPDIISYISVGPISDIYGNLIDEGNLGFSVNQGSILSENPTKVLSGYSFFAFKSDGTNGLFNSSATINNLSLNRSIKKASPQLVLNRNPDFTAMTIGQSKCEVLLLTNSGSMVATNLDIQSTFPFLLLDNQTSDALCPIAINECSPNQNLRSGESCSLRVKFTMPSTSVVDGELTIQMSPQEYALSLLIQKLRTQSIQAAQLISSNPFISFGGTQCSTARTVDIYVQNIGDFDATGIVVQNPPPNTNQSNPFFSIILPPQDVVSNPNINSVINCGSNFPAGRKCRIQIQFNPTAGILNQVLIGKILGNNINPLILSMSGYTVPGNGLNTFPINFITPNNILPLGMLIGNTQQSRVDVGPIVDACNQRVADGSIISASVTAGSLLQQTLVSNNGFASFQWNSGNDISKLGNQSIDISVGVNGSKSGSLLFKGVNLVLSGNSNFGQVIDGKPKELTVTLTNNGNILAQNLSILANSPLAIIDKGTCNINQLAPQSSCQIIVRADPQGINQDLFVPMNVFSSSTGNNNIVFNFSLNARTKPILSLNKTEYLFNDGNLKSVYTQNIILINNGPAISYDTVANIESPFFIQSTDCTSTLNVNQSCTITVGLNSSDTSLAVNKKISISNEVNVGDPSATLGFSRLQPNPESILGIQNRCLGPYNISIVGSSGILRSTSSQSFNLSSLSNNIIFFPNSGCNSGTEITSVQMNSGSLVSNNFYLKSEITGSFLILVSHSLISNGTMSIQFNSEFNLNVPVPNALIDNEKLLLTPTGGFGNYSISFSTGGTTSTYADIIHENSLDQDGNYIPTGNKILSVKTVTNNQSVIVRLSDDKGFYKDFPFNLYQPLSTTASTTIQPQNSTLISFNNYGNPNTTNFIIQNYINPNYINGSLYSSSISSQGYFSFGSFTSDGVSLSAREYVLIQIPKATGGFLESRVVVNIQCPSNYVLSGNQCLRLININISSLILNYNIFSAALNPVDKVFVNVMISSTGFLASNSTASPALTTGSGWNSGSIINIINNGKIYGMGGNGGVGGSNYGQNTAGGSGGSAIVLQYPATINTANGSIFGGGGGGGGSTSYDLVNTLSCGGGGGGGQGYNTSSGGPVGLCYSRAYYPQGVGGSSGNQNSIGYGGAGGAMSTNYGTTINQPGGNGGSWGQAGANGGISYNAANPSVLFNSGMAGGAAGYAVMRNGHNVTWISGFDFSHVKGPVQ